MAKAVKISWTRNGKIFTIILILTLALAYWMQQSLLFLLASFFGGYLLIDFVFSLIILTPLGIDVTGLKDGFEGSTIPLQITLSGPAKKLGYWSRDLWMDIYLDYGKGSEMRHPDSRFNLTILLERRGIITLRQIVLNSGFPFGFFHALMAVSLEKPVFVYPEPIEGGQTITHIERSGNLLNMSEEYDSLETYREGDDVRRIHWKKSAISQVPVVRTHRGERTSQHSNLFIPDPTPKFERALGIFTSWILEHPEETWAVVNEQGEWTDFEDTVSLLQYLAVIQPLTHKPIVDGALVPFYASDIAVAD
jgi:uncharacterized protein (DUF58 family)